MIRVNRLVNYFAIFLLISISSIQASQSDGVGCIASGETGEVFCISRDAMLKVRDEQRRLSECDQLLLSCKNTMAPSIFTPTVIIGGIAVSFVAGGLVAWMLLK